MLRALSFAVALALLVGGSYLLVTHILYADLIRGAVLLWGGVMVGLGGYWLWQGFIAPALRRKTGD